MTYDPVFNCWNCGVRTSCVDGSPAPGEAHPDPRVERDRLRDLSTAPDRFLVRNLRHGVETERRNSLEFNNGKTLRYTEVTAHLTVEIHDHDEAHLLAKIIADFFEGLGR